MKKKVLAMVLTAVCAMGLMAGCGNSGNAATGTQNAATESGYKVGISLYGVSLQQEMISALYQKEESELNVRWNI